MIDASKTLAVLDVGGVKYHYYSLPLAERLGLPGISRLPFALKTVLENLLRQQAEGRADGSDVDALARWIRTRSSTEEIAFLPTRMLIPDSSGIPLFGDLAAMRDAMTRLGGDPRSIDPTIPIDFIVDHSVMVDVNATADAAQRNMALEIERNKERYLFLRWVAQAFDNLRVFPPGAGICHQINLEHLARVVWTREEDGRTLAFPDSLIGMDSHTPMVNSLGVIGWGVGGLEGGAAALGEPVSLLVPAVVGCRLSGRLGAGVTATDLVLTITQVLRRLKLAGKVVEFFGPGVEALSLPDRATIANMSPESGATMGFFAIDEETLRFLRLTGRTPQQVALVAAYARAQGLWRDPALPDSDYTEDVEIDLASVGPSVAGPRRPNERVSLAQAPAAFAAAFPAGASSSGGGTDVGMVVKDGDIVIAAITSCTNTSNPAVMIAAGLLARNAVQRGLTRKPWVKTSLAPGSLVVADYLAASGLQGSLDALGFNVVGFGCTTCMGNSGPIAAEIADAIRTNDVSAVAVLSGNRNFEGRIHPSVRANFLASPPLVVAYALVGSIRADLTREPLGTDRAGAPVYLRDIWPDDAEVRQLVDRLVTPRLYLDRYATVLDGPPQWRAMQTTAQSAFPWDAHSSFIRRPPFFDTVGAQPEPMEDIHDARVLGMFGDMLTTDHISPIGAITQGTPAAAYLASLGIAPRDFVNYAARRLNHDVMIRGTFGNIRLRNELTPEREGSWTRHFPDGETMSIPEAAERYRGEGVPLVIVGGQDYGAGSSRDWAAKGSRLLGVRAVLAESFERIHRSNLLGMGVLPLEFPPGISRQSLGFAGSERFDITGIASMSAPRQQLRCTITRDDGRTQTLSLLARLDTKLELEYYRQGGILNHVLRGRLARGAQRPASRGAGASR
jgi:aconitate hydratase